MSANVSILGNLGKTPESRVNSEGTLVTNFSIASNSVRNTPNGTMKKTDWFRVTAIGKQAETLAKYLNKGSQILVRGKLTFNPWLSRDGEARVSADVVLQDFEFAGSGASKPAGETASEAVSAKQNTSELPSIDASEEGDEEKAEMLAALGEMDAADEQFAGQY